MKIEPSNKTDWFDITEIFEDEHKTVKKFPGLVANPQQGKLEVPLNLVSAKPSLFGVEVPAVEPLDCEILRPYQKEAAGLIRSRNGVLLALTMGSGKSITATAALAHNMDPLPRTLITGPLMSRGSWCGEKSDPYRFFGIDVKYVEGRKNACLEAIEGAQWMFCHYDILDAWFPFIACHFKPEAVIFDECHLIKNAKAVRSKKVQNLIRLNTVEKRIALSGTPVLNGVMDLWPQLDSINPDAWGKRWQFGQRYTAVEFSEYGPKYNGQANTPELQKRLDAIMYRKDRSELLAQLPPMTRQSIAAELDPKMREEYSAVFRDIRKYLKEKMGDLANKITGEKLVALTRLMEIAGLGKVQTTATLCDTALDGHDKIVVFCWHKTTAKALKKAVLKLKRGVEVFGPVSGDMSADKRFKTMDNFAASPNKAVFIATIASAGVALNNLVAASCCIFNDLYWLPGPLLQAEARLHRSGQKNPVNVYYVYAENTIDDQMLEKIFNKSAAIEAAAQGDEASGLAGTLSSGEEEGSALDDLCDFIMDDEMYEGFECNE